MKKCNKCQKEFLGFAIIDGIRKNLQNRKYCMECSPYGFHNTKKLEQASPNQLIKKCPKCKENLPATSEFFHKKTENRLAVYCKKCTNIQSLSRQRSLKELAVAYKGGKCQVISCGYNGYAGAFDFHHIDRNEKDFTIAHVKCRSFESIKSELDKCVLVCCRCHREIEAGIIPCPH